jgi:hypothetical protein
MNTKWVILGCFGILFVFAVIASIGGAILWHMPEVRKIFSDSKQPAVHNENPVPMQPAQYNSPNNQPQPQRLSQNRNENQQKTQNQKQQKQNQTQTQSEIKDDDYDDNEEYDDSGDPKDDKIINTFDDFNNNKSAKPSGNQNQSLKRVDVHGIKTVPKSYGGCTGLAPENWAVSGAENNVAVGIDFVDSQQLEGATYMVIAVTTYIDAYGNDFYGNSTPERSIQSTLTALGVSGFQYISQGMRLSDGYVLLFWQGYAQGQPVRGFAHYMTFPTDQQNIYIMALRYGFTQASMWEKRMNVVYDVAASARCQKRLFPVRNNGYTHSSSARKEPRGSSKDLSTLREETTMEFKNVYSPSTGEHWEASYDDYNPTGPDGPGYYRQVGNSYEKLAEGFPPE